MVDSETALDINTLISKSAKDILDGVTTGDRSALLANFMKEVYGWSNALESQEIEYLDNVDELIQECAEVIYGGEQDGLIEHKIASVLKDPDSCQPSIMHFEGELGLWKQIKYAAAKVNSDAYSKCPQAIKDEIEGITAVRNLGAKQSTKESSNSKTKKSQNDFVSELKHQYKVEFIKDSNSGDVYLKINHKNKGIEVLDLQSSSCKNFINRGANQILGTVLKPDDFNLVKTIIETEASEDTTASYPLNIRVGRNGNTFCIDQGDTDFNVYSITHNGITLNHNLDNLVLFKRPNNLEPLQTPNLSATPVESFNALRQLCAHLPEDSVYLLWYGIAYNLTALPDKPLIILKGYHGSGKTGITEIIKNLIDPSKNTKLSAPKDEQALMIQANQNWVISYDNLSPKAVTSEISDYFCKLSTGSGFMTRTLYTNSDATAFNAMRPVVINCIENIARRPDLLDRALLIDVPEIPENQRVSREEQKVKTALLVPIILGGLMNALRAYLQAVENNYTTEVNLLRMADFHKFAITLEHACNLPSNITEVYTQNRLEGTEDVATSDPICLCIMELLSDPSRKGNWQGTATELLNILTHIKNHSYHEYLKETLREAWVSSPKHLSERLKRITPTMRTQGYVIDFNRTKTARSITINKHVIKAPATIQINKSFLERILALPCEESKDDVSFHYPDLSSIEEYDESLDRFEETQDTSLTTSEHLCADSTTTSTSQGLASVKIRPGFRKAHSHLSDVELAEKWLEHKSTLKRF